MKKTSLIIVWILCALACWAQVPDRISYQAVIRNANNTLVASAPVGIRVSILQGSVSGSPVYVENQTATTNVNGVVALEIGGGNVQSGDFSAINWGTSTYFIKIEADPTGGNNYTLSSTQQLLSVPYALCAKKSAGDFSGNYYDLTNRPNIPTVPSNVSAFDNDAHYLTSSTLYALMDSILQPYIFTIDSLITLVNYQTTLINSLEYNMDIIINNGFRCGIYRVADYDGNEYATVQIGNQCWMKENLRTRHYSNGVPIPFGTTTDNVMPYCYYPNNSSQNVLNYGLLYNWPAVMNGASSATTSVQGICPNGWHLPKEADWVELFLYAGYDNDCICDGNFNYIAKSLASATGWVNSSVSCAVGNQPSSNNATGFSALPAGLFNGQYTTFSSAAYFWSDTPVSSTHAYQCNLKSSSPEVDVDATGFNKNNALSVRCLLNQ